MLRNFFAKNKEILWFLSFPAIWLFYFISQIINLNYYTVHIALDDKIPFLPIFIIPYILWYVYIPLPMVYTYIKDRPAFKKQALSVFTGMFICCAIFILFPTNIDMRPTAEGKGVLLYLCRLIYANDNPVNVFPSMHCFEAVAIHLSTFTFGKYKQKKLLRISSAIMMILICLSTVFVKQHSIVDLIAGCLLAIIICILVNFLGEHNDNRNI